MPAEIACQTSFHSGLWSVPVPSFSKMAQPVLAASKPPFCAAAFRFINCSLLVASPWNVCCCGDAWMLGCIVAPVVAAAAGIARWRGVYGTYLVVCMVEVVVSTEPVVADTEDEDDPGMVGESRGCAVKDSCEPVRFRPP